LTKDDNKLPISKTEVPAKNLFPFKNDNNNTPSLIEQLHKICIPFKARSAFAANSGKGDLFYSATDLVHSTRDEIFLDESAIPAFRTTDFRGAQIELNAYVTDFYSHGQFIPLEQANGIRKGDIWYILNDFSVILKAISSFLELMNSQWKETNQFKSGALQVAKIFSQISDEFAEKLKEQGA